MLSAITVYCSSSRHVDPVYFDAARDLGRGIASRGWKLVYGGNNVGSMGVLADAARAAGGTVIGITPQLLVDKGIADTRCDELIVTSDMRRRKGLLEERGDAFIALPGGIGTFEEIFEIIVGRYLGYHAKPIVLLNIAGYYDHLLAMLRLGIERRFIKASLDELFFTATDVESALRYLECSATTTSSSLETDTAQTQGLSVFGHE
jgi:hypothetical protein